jgi:uncharacterized transporter YbjL
VRHCSNRIAEFTKELGLILFVFTKLIKRLCQNNDTANAGNISAHEETKYNSIERRGVAVDNDRLRQNPFDRIAGIERFEGFIARASRVDDGDARVVIREAVIQEVDVVQVPGTKAGLDRLTTLRAHTSDVALMSTPGDAEHRKVFVTAAETWTMTLQKLALDLIDNVTATRIIRAGVDMTASPV